VLVETISLATLRLYLLPFGGETLWYRGVEKRKKEHVTCLPSILTAALPLCDIEGRVIDLAVFCVSMEQHNG